MELASKLGAGNRECSSVLRIAPESLPKTGKLVARRMKETRSKWYRRTRTVVGNLDHPRLVPAACQDQRIGSCILLLSLFTFFQFNECMLGGSENYEVLYSVVSHDPVDVVHLFPLFKLAPKEGFHNRSVFPNPLAVSVHMFVVIAWIARLLESEWSEARYMCSRRAGAGAKRSLGNFEWSDVVRLSAIAYSRLALSLFGRNPTGDIALHAAPFLLLAKSLVLFAAVQAIGYPSRSLYSSHNSIVAYAEREFNAL